MMHKIGAFCAVAVFLVGCELDYGINRFADLKSLPNLACLRRVLDSTPGIQSVVERHYVEDEASRDTSPQFHSYSYKGKGFWANLNFQVERDGKIWMLHDRISVNDRPSRQEIEITRRVMRSVEKSLETECAIRGLTNAIKEECVRVNCADEES